MTSPLPKILSNVLTCRSFVTSICPPPQNPVVTLLDAFSSAGTNLVLLLKQNPHIKELRLYDEERSTHSLVQDLCDIDTGTNVRSFSCRSLKGAIQGAHLVISTGGCQCKPGQSQSELFHQNLDNVRNAAIFLAEFNPAAVYCIAKPPVEALVPMASEEYKKAETYDPCKIIGVTTPSSMIANTLIAKQLQRDPAEVLCPVIGGMSPKTTVPVISQAKPSVPYDSVKKLYTTLYEAIANAEEDLLKKEVMFCYSKACAIARFVNLFLRALKGDKNCVECAYVAQTGHIAEFLPYMTSVIRLGPQGVASTHMPQTNELETSWLRAAMPHIQENIHLGQTFLHGGDLPHTTKKVCDELLKQKIQECNSNMMPQQILS